MTFLRKFYHNQSGAVAVEFVFIAPILFALVLGIISLGYFIGVSHSVHQLAAGAARASVVGLNAAERSSLAAAYLSEGHTRYPLLGAETLTSAFTFEDVDSGAITVTVAYNIEGTLLDVANSFLNFEVTTINGDAYLAY